MPKPPKKEKSTKKANKKEESKPHDLPFKEKDMEKVPSKWRLIEYMMQHNGKGEESNLEKSQKEQLNRYRKKQMLTDNPKSTNKDDRKNDYKFKMQIKKDEKLLRRLKKQKEEYEAILNENKK